MTNHFQNGVARAQQEIANKMSAAGFRLENAVKVGWYVEDANGKLRGPMSESEAKKQAKEEKGENATYLSDYDVKRMNEK